MTVQLLAAPAAAGKTAYVLNLARDAARDLDSVPRVVVATRLQQRAWRRRLAEAGGAIGVRLFTFDQLYAECLGTAREAYTELSEAVRYRLIRATVDDLSLEYYAPLVDRPGFIQVLEGLIAELKATRVDPQDLLRAVDALGGEPRLYELARVYEAYQICLQSRGWADRPGLGWLATEALEERALEVARDWPLLIVDGFGSFTPVQLDLLRVLAGRVARTIVTLTGTSGELEGRQAHRRFDRTRSDLEDLFGVGTTPLPEPLCGDVPALAHLEANLQVSGAIPVGADGAVELVAAPDRATEVRAALRWLKARLLLDGMQPWEVALLARRIAHYHPFILQTAAEYGLPVRMVEGLPLRSNPAVAALLGLLRLVLPHSTGSAQPALPRHSLVEAWRSPYFDWSALPKEGATEPVGIQPGDADLLDAVGRWGRVIGGLSQWREALERLIDMPDRSSAGDAGLSTDIDRELPPNLPTGRAARELWEKLERFLRRLTPPEGDESARVFVGWLEDLIGPDPVSGSGSQFTRSRPPEISPALNIVDRARDGGIELEERDLAALQALKDLLRGLIWAEDALGSGRALSFGAFVDELAGAVEAAVYHLPPHPDREEILVASVVEARGLPFRAVAVLGLAEGEFPATLGEDPFLRDADRLSFRDRFGFPLDSSTESTEIEYFYDTVTRPREQLLLTRPRLASTGALWQPSAFWEEVCDLVDVKPRRLTSESAPGPRDSASWPELIEGLAADPGYERVWEWIESVQPDRRPRLEEAVRVHRLRHLRHASSPFDGDLHAMAGFFNRRFDSEQIWSASRLEAYRTCPFFFYVATVLRLEPREEPVEGLDARQLGNIYHHILEGVYQASGVSDPNDLAQVLGALPAVARTVLDAAPQQEGFRETAWWEYTRGEILGNVERSLGALASLPQGFIPSLYEASFGLRGQPALVVRDGDDRFQVRGFIDRLDRDAAGRLRVIDYKTAGPSSYTKKAVVEGKKLQLPLYALAAQEALGLGRAVEGFYWHVQHAERSSFTLARFDGGPEAAMAAAAEKAWEAVRGARDGFFAPHPPDIGCPSYCPASGFCWHYRPGFGG